MQPIWHGNQLESELLVRAINNNCGCDFAPSGVLREACGAHRILTHDQRALNGLLFGRAIREQLMQEEWSVQRTAEQEMSQGTVILSQS
jgi:hypothetical protein